VPPSAGRPRQPFQKLLRTLPRKLHAVLGPDIGLEHDQHPAAAQGLNYDLADNRHLGASGFARFGRTQRGPTDSKHAGQCVNGLVALANSDHLRPRSVLRGGAARLALALRGRTSGRHHRRPSASYTRPLPQVRACRSRRYSG
jgi:hypothetical protein